MSVSTDAMYNSESRYLHQKFLIYFSANNVLEVLRSNYLVSSNIFDESGKTSSSPFGDISSNELELSLLNDNGIFNPKNTSSPYYGFIRRDIKIEAFIRPDEVDEWDPAGVFYVKDWNTSSSGTTAEIVAYDKLYSILNSPVPSLRIVRDITFAQFIKEYFALFGVEVTVDEAIDLVLPYGFTSGYTDNRRLLADLMIAAIADCFCKHDGNIVVRSKVASREVRAEFTDNDQIISAAIKQSLSTDYDSVKVTCNTMQESAEQSILSISDFAVKPGITSTGLTKFSIERVVSVRSIRAEGTVTIKPVSFEATADDIILDLQSTSDAIAQLEVNGTVLEKVSSIFSTDGISAIELDSLFVQTQDNATRVANYVDKYVNAAMPTLDLVIRGNPKLELGDLIHVNSNKYKVDYTGVLTKIKSGYNGGLSCEVTLTVLMAEEG